MFAAIGTAFAATAIGAYSSLRKGDAVTPLVFAWALYAIHKDGAHRAPPASPSKPDVDTKRAKSGGKVASTKNTSTNEIPSKTITKLITDIVRACACINAGVRRVRRVLRVLQPVKKSLFDIYIYIGSM